jgi:hypothetical protein
MAQKVTPQMIPETAEGLGPDAEVGWSPLLKVAANGAVGQTTSVPGTPDGTTVSLGYLITGHLGFLDASRHHEWINDLVWKLSYARSPVVDAWAKSVDGIDLRSNYLFHIKPWFGPFVAVRLTTPMLSGYTVPAANTNVLKLRNREEQLFDDTGVPVDADGAVLDANHPRVATVKAGRRIELTGPFAPLMLRESIGAFALPVDKPLLRVDIRAGLGAWESFVRGGYAIADNADTSDLFELRRMQDSVQLGPEVGIVAGGVVGSMLNYGVGFLFMYPVWHNANTDLQGADLINLEFDAKLGIKPVSWASIDYSFSAVKNPFVVNEWQVQNNLLVSISFTVLGKEPAPPACECPACECPACPSEEPPAEELPVEEAPVQPADDKPVDQESPPV